jgi:hypothetical protein
LKSPVGPKDWRGISRVWAVNLHNAYMAQRIAPRAASLCP